MGICQIELRHANSINMQCIPQWELGAPSYSAIIPQVSIVSASSYTEAVCKEYARATAQQPHNTLLLQYMAAYIMTSRLDPTTSTL